ncbi:MAG: FHA domain-containing protein [Prochloraceae cyanobacterium]|nr:FHA domain-containing protein [Prochloraceae cyanobacterium]
MSYLIYIPESGNRKTYELKFGVNKIGRHPANNVPIIDPSMSRHHAEIEITQNEIIIKDCGSSNHTYVNGTAIKQPKLLKGGESIRFGNANFKFVSAASPQENFVENEFPQTVVKKFTSQQNVSVINNLVSSQTSNNSILKLSDANPEQRSLQKLKILLEVSQELCSPENPEKMLSKILELLFKVMEIDRAVILLVDEKSYDLKPRAVKLREGVEDNQRFYSTKITESVRETGESILTSDAITDERFHDAPSIICSSVHASICVPLITHNQTIGVVYIDNLFLTSVYSDEDVDFLIGLANQAAAAINMANEFYKREKKLKQQIRKLQIKIDQNKKEREVDEIIASDYFKNLEAKARSLRNDREKTFSKQEKKS